MEAKAKCCFEISWEVCNKVGGIYTVIASKAEQMMRFYPDLITIGPYFARKAAGEFVQETPPEPYRTIFEKLKKEGIVCYYGRWLIKGKPATILISFSQFMDKKNEIKTELWNNFQVDSLRAGFDFDEPAVWGYCVGRFLEELNLMQECKKVVCHFHEWLTGSALLYAKLKKLKVKTVFTTHATILGRTISGSNRALYDILDKIDPLVEAKQYFIESKHTLEKASANNADIFTTVSEITGLEAQYLLGRKPDVLVPNGLDFNRFPNLEEIPTNHSKYKEKIHEFLIPYFFPFSTFDLNETLIFYISGRYEFRNKGIDIFIEALGRLNQKLKEEKSKRTIVTFFFIPAECGAAKLQILENKSLFEDIKDSVDDYIPEIKQKIMDGIANKKLPIEVQLFDEDFVLQLKRSILSFKKEGTAPLVTHDLNENTDATVTSFRRVGLHNRPEDRVKVIFYPGYLSSSDGLLDLDYYPAVCGSHLGVFPSYYEPWGYTPLESAAYGVPAITTDLAGFGRFLLQMEEYGSNHHKQKGIIVLKRFGKTDEEVITELAGHLYWYSTLPKKERIDVKVVAEHLAPVFDWKNLVEHYIEAHNRAIGD
ncbi:MAG: glycogen/starch synthase [Candidatus Woesearchaeota archaeon]